MSYVLTFNCYSHKKDKDSNGDEINQRAEILPNHRSDLSLHAPQNEQGKSSHTYSSRDRWEYGPFASDRGEKTGTEIL